MYGPESAKSPFLYLVNAQILALRPKSTPALIFRVTPQTPCLVINNKSRIMGHVAVLFTTRHHRRIFLIYCSDPKPIIKIQKPSRYSLGIPCLVWMQSNQRRDSFKVQVGLLSP